MKWKRGVTEQDKKKRKEKVGWIKRMKPIYHILEKGGGKG